MKKGIHAVLLLFGIFLFSGQLFAADDGNNPLGQVFPQLNQSGQSIRQSYDTLSRMIGKTALDPQGNTIGQIQNIIIGQGGRTNYLIVAQGYLLGSSQGNGQSGAGNQRLIPVPWSVANPTFQGNNVQIDVSRQALDNAPGFNAGSWPNFASNNVMDRVHSYFGSTARSPGNLNQFQDQRNLNR